MLTCATDHCWNSNSLAYTLKGLWLTLPKGVFSFLFFFLFFFFFFSVSPYLIGYIISNSTLPLSFPSCWSDFVARNSEYTCTLILVHYHFYPTGHTCSTVKGERSTNTCCHWTWWWWTTDQWIHSGRFTCIRDKWSCRFMWHVITSDGMLCVGPDIPNSVSDPGNSANLFTKWY